MLNKNTKLPIFKFCFHISPKFCLSQVPEILQYSPDLISLLNVLQNVMKAQMLAVADLSGIVQDQVGNLEDVVGRQFSEDLTFSLLVSHLL